jgi:hypothetical protein
MRISVKINIGTVMDKINVDYLISDATRKQRCTMISLQ